MNVIGLKDFYILCSIWFADSLYLFLLRDKSLLYLFTYEEAYKNFS